MYQLKHWLCWLVTLCLKTLPEIDVSTLVVTTILGVNVLITSSGHVSNGYISSQGMYRIYYTGSAFEVWLQWEINIT